VAINMSLLNPPSYSNSVVNDRNNVESVIKHEPPEHTAYSKGLVNDRNIIESGKKHEPPEPPTYIKGVVND
jgi:hypothetical protein